MPGRRENDCVPTLYVKRRSFRTGATSSGSVNGMSCDHNGYMKTPILNSRERTAMMTNAISNAKKPTSVGGIHADCTYRLALLLKEPGAGFFFTAVLARDWDELILVDSGCE